MPRSYSRRARGEGSIYETGDGRLRGSLLIPHPDGSRSIRRVVSGRTKAEVVRKLDALKREAAAGYASGETTGDYLTRWAVAVRPGLRPATVREYSGHVVRYLIPNMGTVELTALQPAHVERVMAEMMKRGLSASTARAARTTLRRALHDAQRDGLIIRNVAALARPPRLVRRELHPLTAADTRRLLDATQDHPYGPLFALLVGSGLRLGEALGLAWADVDTAARSLVVRRSLARADGGGYELAEPKTRQSRRTVMLAAVALEALNVQRERQDAAKAAAGSAWQDRLGLAFCDPIGRPLSPTVVSHGFREAADALGLPVRLHDLRHTAATLLLGAGAPLKVVSEMLGHSSIAITADVYAHVTPELRREAADAMDRALGAGV